MPSRVRNFTSSKPRRALSAMSPPMSIMAKKYIAVLSGVGGWAGIGLAAGLTKGTDGLGAVGGYAARRITPLSADN